MSVTDRVLADRPQVHSGGGGVWATDPACYRLIEANVHEGTVTLETGLGVSTALFAMLGARHLCVTLGHEEVAAFRDHCEARDIDLSNVTIHTGQSDAILPKLDLPPLDVVFIDGGHGFPAPIIDWWYAGGALRDGGLFVLDDTHLPAPRLLAKVLDAAPEWEVEAKAEQWTAYRRRGGDSLRQEWVRQPYMSRIVGVPVQQRARKAVMAGKRLMRRAGFSRSR